MIANSKAVIQRPVSDQKHWSRRGVYDAFKGFTDKQLNSHFFYFELTVATVYGMNNERDPDGGAGLISISKAIAFGGSTMLKRLLNETEKLEVRRQQVDSDGVLRCFILGKIIGEADAIEYDHIEALVNDGDTSVANVRIVLKELNRRKGSETLYDIRNNIKLERLFEERNNNIWQQDIFELKDVERHSTVALVKGAAITIEDGIKTISFPLHVDAIL